MAQSVTRRRASDTPNFRFSNHEKANQEILSRNYREGFAPPSVS